MASTSSVVAERTLASTSELSTTSSCCPTKDLIVLAAKSRTSLNLLRTSNQADQVWSFKLGSTSHASKHVKGKGKVNDAQFGEITEMSWHPQGGYIAIASSRSTVTILSVHTGLPVLPAFQLPSAPSTSSSPLSPITHLSWSTLDPTTCSIESFAANLIFCLPGLPTLESKSTATSAAVAASGVFGTAKNAMLMRERAKEASRALDVVMAAKGLPTLITNESLVGERLGDSLLIVGDRAGKVHLYLGGSVLIGSIEVDSEASLIGASILPSSTSSATMDRDIFSLALLRSSHIDQQLIISSFCISLPPVTLLVAQQATMLREMVQHAFESMQEGRVLWDEARRITTAWLARLADLGEPHGVSQSPTAQLFSLLVTGRSNPALLDFLASKMNERGFTKLETATNLAFQRLKKCTFMSLAPALERAVLLLDEAKVWSSWPEQFDRFAFDVTALRQSIALASEVILRSCELEILVVDEELSFLAFCRWFRYELEKISFADGSDVRPRARYHPVPVAHHIYSCLADSPITPYLAFGLAATSLDHNTDLAHARAWCRRRDLESEAVQHVGTFDGKDEESLEKMTKRMKEELRGQLDATLLGSRINGVSTSLPAKRVPPPSIEDKDQSPTSIPLMLHLMAQQVGAVFGDSLRNLVGDVDGRRVKYVGERDIAIGKRISEEAVVRSRLVRENVTSSLYCAWISGGELLITRTNLDTSSLESISFSLTTEEARSFEVIDFDFLDDVELILAIRTTGSQDNALTAYSISTIAFTTLAFLPRPLQAPAAAMLLSASYPLVAHFPVSQVAFDSRLGRRIACLLGGSDGRRLEVLNLAIGQTVVDTARHAVDVVMG